MSERIFFKLIIIIKKDSVKYKCYKGNQSKIAADVLKRNLKEISIMKNR
jgi:rhodanese-related sulfurtransferase